MMLYPTLDELTAKIGSRFYLVNYVAHRARQINRKAIRDGEHLDAKPVRLALEEIEREPARKPDQN